MRFPSTESSRFEVETVAALALAVNGWSDLRGVVPAGALLGIARQAYCSRTSDVTEVRNVAS